MPEIIQGEFRRVKKRGKRSETLGAVSGGKILSQVDNGNGTYTTIVDNGNGTVTTYLDNGDGTSSVVSTTKQSGATDIPLGVQAWEYLHQGEVQTESVILTNTNNPHAMDENVFYRIEQDARAGADAAVNAAQQVLNSGTNWLTLAAIAFVLFNVLTAGK